MFTIMQETSKGRRFNPATHRWEQPERKLFAKIFDKEHPTGRASEMAWQFDVLGEVNPRDLDEAFSLIEDLSANPYHVVVRAKCTALSKTNMVRKKINFDTSVKSNIIAIDVDGIEDDGGHGLFDLEGRARHVIKLLNSVSEDMFPLDTGFIAHASSSAGIKPGIRMHMLLEADTLVSQGQLKYMFSSINESSRQKYGFDIADLAYYSSVQVHYFADPIFRDGIEDPFKVENMPRLVKVKGAKVRLPSTIPDYETTRGEFQESFNSLLDKISGIRGVTSERLEEAIQELEEADDGVYLRIIPRIYHLALAEALDLNWLERQLTPALEEYIATKNNERTIEEYFRNGRREALKAFVHNSKRIIPPGARGIVYSKIETDSKETENFLKLKRLPPEDHLTFLKASLGTGKTTTVVNWLDSDKISGNFLAITNTRSLVSSNAKRFKSGQYDKGADMLNFKRGGINRMSTTIHSLHKFKNQVNNIDFVFIDEADSVMNDLLFSPVVKQRLQCRNVLAEILANAKYVILADGDISEETIEAYGGLINFSKEVSYYDHHRKMMQDVKAFEFPDEDSVWVAFETALTEGEKCIMVSDCGPDELNEKGITLRETTGCIVKEIHSASTEDVDIRRILDYTTKELINQAVDGLLCSPSVTSGVDFNYFDSVFVITRTPNQTPNLRFQALRRDRGAKSIYYFTDKSTNGFSAGSEQFEIDEGWLERTQHFYAKRRERECRQFQSTFRYYLLDQGASIEVFSEKWGKLKDCGESYIEQRVAAILSSTVEYSPPRHNDAYEAKLQCMRYYDVESLKDLTPEIVMAYVKDKPQKRAEFFSKIWDLFWDDIKKCNNLTVSPFVEALKKKKRDFFLRTGQSAAPKYARMYLSQMGIGKDMDTEQAVKWFRTYCQIQAVQVPVQFMTEEEYKLYKETAIDLGVTVEERE